MLLCKRWNHFRRKTTCYYDEQLVQRYLDITKYNETHNCWMKLLKNLNVIFVFKLLIFNHRILQSVLLSACDQWYY